MTNLIELYIKFTFCYEKHCASPKFSMLLRPWSALIMQNFLYQNWCRSYFTSWKGYAQSKQICNYFQQIPAMQLSKNISRYDVLCLQFCLLSDVDGILAVQREVIICILCRILKFCYDLIDSRLGHFVWQSLDPLFSFLVIRESIALSFEVNTFALCILMSTFLYWSSNQLFNKL